MRMNKTFAFLSAFVGTIKNGQVFVAEIRSAFDGHGSAHIIIGSFYLIIVETERFQKAPLQIEILFRLKTKALQALFTQCVYIEYKTDLESGCNGSIQLLDL